MDGLWFAMLGIVAGLMSGLLGIGGGLLMVPALIYLFGFNQVMAQGTSLAVMIPPIGILAAYRYWASGHVNIAAAIWIALGFILGSPLGAEFAHGLPVLWLKKIFGVFLLMVSLQMIVGK